MTVTSCRRPRSRRHTAGLPALLASALVAGVFGGVVAYNGGGGHTAYAKRHREWTDAAVTVGRTAIGPPIPAGFVGLSVEYPALRWYTGYDPAAVNPVFEQLIRGLAPGQSPVLRLGGDSTDTTWVPAPGVRRPGGVKNSLGARWLATASALVRAVHARLIMGIDLEAGVPALAVAEARSFLQSLGGSLQAFEVGNEAPRYGNFPWYHDGAGKPVLARRSSYGFEAFDREFVTVARRLPAQVPTAGPTLGGPQWMTNLERFIDRAPRLGLVTFHTYPFNRCFTPLRSPAYPTIPRLLSKPGSRGFAPELRGYLAIARRHHLPFRIDEINSVACGGKRGVSDTFASALWALDSLFELARIGVSGVNFHMFPAASYSPFTFRRINGRWVARIRPEYYGLLMFVQAAPPGSRLLSTRIRGGPALRAWATRTASGTLRVVLLNDDLHKRHVFLVRARAGHGTVVRLSAPSARATGGVTLGEQRFGLTSTGTLSAPEQEPVTSDRGRYVIALAPASAALLTVRAR